MSDYYPGPRPGSSELTPEAQPERALESDERGTNHWRLECRRCGHVRHLHASHSKGALEAFLTEAIGLRAYRCHACQWRGHFPVGIARVVKKHLRTKRNRRILVALGTVLFIILVIEAIIFMPEIGDRLVPATPFGDH
ncbi:MAG: hypothetical protein IT186_04755 [Acidobacteria bacterium]|nr:hypothetical protein [Acidobacteriota bacterium]